MKKKLLSIIIVGRNDDYLGNYVYRLQTCLNFLAQNLKTLGRLDDVEVVLVDWNSQGDETLADVVRVSPEAAGLVRFVIVPPAVAHSRNPMVSFFTTCAVNVGVRRAKGEFVMLADSDSMITLPSLQSLLQVLDGDLPTPWPRNEVIFPIPRHQIPGGIGARMPSVDQWTKILMRIFGSRRKESPGADCLGGYSAAQLMHRDIWFEVGGYNEKLDRAWGWSDNELMLRVSQKYNWMDLGYYGVAAFHIEHHAASVTAHSRNPDSINLMQLTYDLHPSPDTWGLANLELTERVVAGVSDWPLDDCYNAPMGYALTTAEAVEDALADSEFEPFLGEMRNRYNYGQEFDETKEDAIRAIVAIANLETPLSVYYFGEPENMLLNGVLDSAPGAEIFFIQPWPEGIVAGRPISPDMLTSHLNFSTHRGFSRVLCLPARDAIETIRKTDPNAEDIELVIVDRAALGDEFDLVFGEILDSTAEGGAIILIDEQKRAPESAELAAVYTGRYLATYRQMLSSGNTSRRSPFVQAENEAELGAAFDVAALPSGTVHVIRKRPTDAVQSTAIAAE